MDSTPVTKPGIRLAVVGAGHWARFVHFPTLHHLRSRPPASGSISLHGICSLDVETSRAMAAQYGFQRVYSDIHELADDPEVDAIAILVPPQHLLGVIQALQPVRTPILMEKPPGGSPAEAEQIARLLQAPHLVAFNRRYAPMNVRFKGLIEGMQDPFFAEGRLYRHNRLGADFIRDTGVHLLSLMTLCFGSIASARTTRLKNPGAPTYNWFVDLRFDSGLPGRLHFFPCSGMHAEQVTVHSPTQTLILEGPDIHEPRGRIHVHKKRTAVPEAPQKDADNYSAPISPIECSTILDGAGISPLITCGFVPEYEEFLALVIGKGISRSTVQGAVDIMRLAAAIESGIDYTRQ